MKEVAATYESLGTCRLQQAGVDNALLSRCIHTMVPEDVDLIFLEFTLNDQRDDYDRRLQARQNHENGMDMPVR